MVTRLVPLQSVAEGAVTVALVQLLTILGKLLMTGVGAWPSTKVTTKEHGADWFMFSSKSLARRVTWKVSPAVIISPGMLDNRTPGAGNWVTTTLLRQLSETAVGGYVGTACALEQPAEIERLKLLGQVMLGACVSRILTTKEQVLTLAPWVAV